MFSYFVLIGLISLCPQEHGVKAELDVTCKSPALHDGLSVNIVNKTAYYTCNNTLQLIGSSNISCINGTWSGDAPNCSAIPDAGTYNNASTNVTHPSSSPSPAPVAAVNVTATHSPNVTVNVTLPTNLPSNQTSSNSTVAPQVTTNNITNATTTLPSTQKPTTPFVLVKCHPLPAFPNGVRSKQDNHRDYVVGTIVRFSCSSLGYILHGPKSIECIRGGVWNDTQPRCIEINPPCKSTPLGTEYRGTLTRTKNNHPCLPWKTLYNVHTEIVNTRFPDGEYESAANFCRNPGMKPGGPYCYVNSTMATEWDYCDIKYCSVPKPAECKNSILGKEYRGIRRTTYGGLACQRWDQQLPHTHTNYGADSFPDNSVSEAQNFCRNPDGEPEGPWCFTMDKKTVWRYCFVPYCPILSCKKTMSGHDYQGDANHTRSHRICQRWDVLAPQHHTFRNPSVFPEATIYETHNYCRNPDNKHGGPWCFTTDPTKAWEYCAVPMCPHNVPSNWISIFGKNTVWEGTYVYQSEKRKFKLLVLSASGGRVTTLFDDAKNSFHMQGYLRSDDRIVFELKGMKSKFEPEFKQDPWLVAGQLIPKGGHWKYQGVIDAPTKGFSSFDMMNVLGSEKKHSTSKHAANSMLAIQLIIGIVVVIILVVALAGLVYYLKKRRLLPFRRNYMAYANFQNPLYDS